MGVMEYTNAFEHLAQHAPEHVDTDTKKRDCYLRGFNTRMTERLVSCTMNGYASAVRMAICLEAKIKAHDENSRGGSHEKKEFLIWVIQWCIVEVSAGVSRSKTP